jgi:hypothetical protein
MDCTPSAFEEIMEQDRCGTGGRRAGGVTMSGVQEVGLEPELGRDVALEFHAEMGGRRRRSRFSTRQLEKQQQQEEEEEEEQQQEQEQEQELQQQEPLPWLWQSPKHHEREPMYAIPPTQGSTCGRLRMGGVLPSPGVNRSGPDRRRRRSPCFKIQHEAAAAAAAARGGGAAEAATAAGGAAYDRDRAGSEAKRTVVEMRTAASVFPIVRRTRVAVVLCWAERFTFLIAAKDGRTRHGESEKLFFFDCGRGRTDEASMIRAFAAVSSSRTDSLPPLVHGKSTPA